MALAVRQMMIGKSIRLLKKRPISSEKPSQLSAGRNSS